MSDFVNKACTVKRLPKSGLETRTLNYPDGPPQVRSRSAEERAATLTVPHKHVRERRMLWISFQSHVDKQSTQRSAVTEPRTSDVPPRQ